MIRNRGKSVKLHSQSRRKYRFGGQQVVEASRGRLWTPPDRYPHHGSPSPHHGFCVYPPPARHLPHQRAVPCVATSGNVAANENAVRSWLNRISPWGREGVRFARGGAEGRAGGEGTEGRSVQRTGESGNGAALRHSDTRAHVKWRVHARRKAGIGSLLRFAIRASSSSSDTFVLLCCLTKKKKKRRNRDRFFLPPPLPPFSFLLVFGARVSANRCNFFLFLCSKRTLERVFSGVSTTFSSPSLCVDNT